MDDSDEDLGDRLVQLFLIFDFSSFSFARSINGMSFLSICSTHVAHTIYIVLCLCGKFSLHILSLHTPEPHLSQLSVTLAASHISQGSCIRLLLSQSVL